ncbi:MAG TPA: methyltransferase domain-containing protein [Nocardioidaceae bacterium]|nr:methyltransferase domain-containing protein [Nocardioidaceae bacterium]
MTTSISKAYPHTDNGYLFDTGSDLGAEHIAEIERRFDPLTRQQLPDGVPGPGARCLDVGSGAGSIAALLAELAGPDGEMHAVDLDTTRLTGMPKGVTVHQHDVRHGLPVDGPFDVIHARLFLQHLPERDQVLADLVAALAPGGWLLLGDVSDRPLHVVTAPDVASADLFRRMMHLSHEVVSPARGLSFAWAHQAAGRLLEHGLVAVEAFEHGSIDVGGGPGCALHANLNRQAQPALLAAGATAEELADYRQLMGDPRFRAWSYSFVGTRGRRPA